MCPVFSIDSISVLGGPTNFIPAESFKITVTWFSMGLGEIKCPVVSKTVVCIPSCHGSEQMQSMNYLLKTNQFKNKTFKNLSAHAYLG